MEENIVVRILLNYVGANKLEFLSGKVVDAGSNNCSLELDKGSVYGFAVKIDSEEEKIELEKN